METGTINSKVLTGDIVLTKDDIDATIVDITDLTAALASYVPTSRTINGQALTSNVTITIPTALASLTQDTTHRTVSDVQINSWDSKQDALGYTAEQALKEFSWLHHPLLPKMNHHPIAVLSYL